MSLLIIPEVEWLIRRLLHSTGHLATVLNGYIETRHCMPENLKANRMAGRLMGVVQIKDNMGIYGKREEHDGKLKKFLGRLQDIG